jgi:nitroimidazol reductase NimA-like FMN-containing flavoprotein (pyridoxamine 5'-phosphate oxidase superfamily)
MRNYQLTEERCAALLERARSGTVAVLDAQGYPYAVPVHFVFTEGKVYFHGLAEGEKVDAIRADSRICFTAYEMGELVRKPDAKYMCNVNTEYESVIIRGRGVLLEEERRPGILKKIVEKYVLDMAGMPMPERNVVRTAVVEIAPERITGKYYTAG